MDALFGMIVLFLIGVWAVWVIKGNQQRPRNNERFIGYINRYDEDGEPYQAEVWEVTEDEDQTYGITRFTKQEQEMIKKGLTFSKLNDKETADKIIALIPQEYIKRIHFLLENMRLLVLSKEFLLNIQNYTLLLNKMANFQKKKLKNYDKFLQIFPRKNE